MQFLVRKLICLIITVLMCEGVFSKTPSLSIDAHILKKIDSSDGLSDVSVYAITQDGIGRMWFGTAEGLNCYDGQNLKVYYTDETDKDNTAEGTFIERMFSDKDGNIYVVQNHNLIKYDLKKDAFETLEQDINPGIKYINDNILYAKNGHLFSHNALTHQKDSSKITPAFITQIISDANTTYLGTTEGLHIYSGNIGDSLTLKQTLLKNSIISTLLRSSTGITYIGTNETLFSLGVNGKLKMHYPTSEPTSMINNNIRSLIEDKFGNIWFGSPNGAHCLDTKTEEVSNLSANSRKGGLSHPYVCSLFFDREENLWIGLDQGGVNYFSPFSKSFKFYEASQYETNCINNEFINDLSQGANDDVWIATENGINKLNTRSNNVEVISKEKYPTIYDNMIKALVYSGRHKALFFSSFCGGVSRYDFETDKVYNYTQYDTLSEKNLESFVYQLNMYKDEVVVRTAMNVYTMNVLTGEKTDIVGTISFCNTVKYGKAWVADYENIYCYDLDKKKMEHIYALSDYGIHGNPSNIIINSKGELCLTVRGAGIYVINPINNDVKCYNKDNNFLHSNYCYRILELPSRTLLATTNIGFSLIDTQSETSKHIDLVHNNTILTISQQNDLIITNNGNVIVSGLGGLVSFFENDINQQPSEINMSFTNLWVNNNKVKVDDETGILTQNMPFMQEINLESTQNNFMVEFASFSYLDILDKPTYLYKLEGFDNEWISTPTKTVSYTNLNPGKYILHIKKSNSKHQNINETISLPIIIKNPWYNSVTAWILYIIAIVSSVYYYNKNITYRRKLMLQAESERLEKERNNALNQEKIRFFTNVSHEFRTPLTLIISQIDILSLSNNLPESVSKSIKKIKKNAKVMNNLITELLDFRKIDQNKISLKVASYNFVDIVREIYFSFYDLASQRSIDYKIECQSDNIECYADLWQIKKVFYNLLSNAFKYTPDNGRISVKIEGQNKEIKIYIEDTGIGMTEEETKQVFERFFQGDIDDNFTVNKGTGVGLALSLAIVEIHKGTITLTSHKNEGSKFCVTLKKGKEHFLGNETVKFITPVATDGVDSQSIPSEDDLLKIKEELTDIDNINDYKILLIDDNPEILRVLEVVFSSFFQTILAADGEEGLELAKMENPDLIVSDIMMPKISGIELCDKIKNNIDLSHIPIVLLTALDSIESNIDGLTRGADDYVLKPFDVRLLLVRCFNIIRNRKLMHKRFASSPQEEITLVASTPLDTKFLEDVTKIIEHNLSDENFDITMMCNELGMSRTNVFKKFKALVGMTPNEYLLNVKLKKSVELLIQNPDTPVIEIAENLGFNSSSYFSRCFKKVYDLTPNEYRKNHIKN